MLAAADGDDNFELVAIAQIHLSILAARHDLAIALYRNTFTGELHGIQ